LTTIPAKQLRSSFQFRRIVLSDGQKNVGIFAEMISFIVGGGSNESPGFHFQSISPAIVASST